MMSLKTNRSNILQAIVILFVVLLIFRMYLGTHSGAFGKILTMGYALMGIYLTVNFKLKDNSPSLYFIILMLFFGITTAIFGKNYKISDILYLFTYFGIALIPTCVKLNYKLFLRFAYGLILFFAIFIFTGTDPNEIFYSASRNGVSEILLMVLGYHLISSFQNEKKPNLFLIVLFFLLSIWAVGRGGIITIGLILAAYPFMIGIKRKYKRLFFLLYVTLVFFVCLFHYDIITSVFKGDYDVAFYSPRLELNAGYLQESCSSFSRFLFGTPLNEVPAFIKIVPENLNPHNSFIRAHLYYGFFGMLLLLCALGFTAFHFLKTKNYVFFSLLIALIIRAFLDSNAFHGPLDTIIFFLIFYAIKNVSFTKKTASN